MKLVYGLDEITDTDGDRVGGKAVALAALHRGGRAVPPTLCLATEAYDLFVEQASLRSAIQQELGRKSFAEMRWEEIWDAALRIRSRFIRAPIPEEIVWAVKAQVLPELPQGFLAVRSSAPGEDSQATSFAGLHDSFVGVQGLTATLEAIRKVWASLWTDRALLYRREIGIDVESSAMAVILQGLVEGPVSGIAFGAHPNDPELVAVEAVYGLNQGLVDGTIEPDRWSLDRRTGRVVEHSAPSERRRLVARGRQTEVESVPVEQEPIAPLNDSGLQQVFEAIRATEELFGGPQDVEWTLDQGRLVLLQSRPITTMAEDSGDKRAWYLSLSRSLHSLLALRDRVENELLPAMDQEAAKIASRDLAALDTAALVEEIEQRRRAHDHWVEVYSSDFIPLAHGIRLFGQFYNDVVRHADPYEFMTLLAATPLLSVHRNRELSRLGARVREDSGLRTRLQAGDSGDAAFEQDIDEFGRQFGEVAFASQKCFGDRARLIRFLLNLAAAPAVTESASETDIEELTEAFFSAVDSDRQTLARQLLELGRASYRLRDDDNIHLARFEALVLDAVKEGRTRLRGNHPEVLRSADLERVLQVLRHPNLVVEPRQAAAEPVLERGFRALPRQLVGQPAGPGVATGAARVIETADDLFRFQAGEVLVCDAVDPNMTFVVPMACAVVERRGGMLIHGAIIAREYGLPCVTGVPEVTSLIFNGDPLTVDGYLGIVTVSRD
ncbi:MAG: PEP/pyruvate-binding domain-containing protein [Thermoanaerobaculia bacterium]